MERSIKSYTLDKTFPVLYYGMDNHEKEVIDFPLICKEEYRKQKSKELTELIEPELLEVSMNPNRLRWFLSVDEQKLYLK